MNKLEPFSNLLTEMLEVEVLKSMRVDRDIELKQYIDALFGRSENLLIYGSRGVGKTFLAKLLLDEIESNFNDTTPVFVNLSGLLAYNGDEVTSFPFEVLLGLCTTIWGKVLNKEYSTLRSVLSETGREIKFRNKGEKKIVDIYRLLLTSKVRMRAGLEYSVGVSSNLGTTRSTQKEWSEIDVLPFEFFEFVEEIKKETLLPYGKKRIVIICDEANKLPIFQQAAILERYIELFAASKVQFVFIAGYHPGEKVIPISYGFQNIIELEGFQDKQNIKELINKHTSAINVSFLDSAIDVVWGIFKGHPRSTLEACRRSFLQAKHDELNSIDARMMAVACAEILRKEEEFSRMLINEQMGGNVKD